MTDVVTVALISTVGTGSVGLISSWFSYRSGVRTAEIDRKRLEQENEHLREQYRQAERQERRSLYIEFVAALDELEAVSDSTSEESFTEIQSNFRRAYATLLVVANPAVRGAVQDLMVPLNAIAADATAADDEKGRVERFVEARNSNKDELGAAVAKVNRTIHEDVIRPLLPNTPG